MVERKEFPSSQEITPEKDRERKDSREDVEKIIPRSTSENEQPEDVAQHQITKEEEEQKEALPPVVMPVSETVNQHKQRLEEGGVKASVNTLDEMKEIEKHMQGMFGDGNPSG